MHAIHPSSDQKGATPVVGSFQNFLIQLENLNKHDANLAQKIVLQFMLTVQNMIHDSSESFNELMSNKLKNMRALYFRAFDRMDFIVSLREILV